MHLVRNMLGVAEEPEKTPETEPRKRKSSSTKGPTGKRAKGHKKEHQALTFRPKGVLRPISGLKPRRSQIFTTVLKDPGEGVRGGVLLKDPGVLLTSPVWGCFRPRPGAAEARDRPQPGPSSMRLPSCILCPSQKEGGWAPGSFKRTPGSFKGSRGPLNL